MLNNLKSKFTKDENKDKEKKDNQQLDIENLDNEIQESKKQEDQGFFGNMTKSFNKVVNKQDPQKIEAKNEEEQPLKKKEEEGFFSKIKSTVGNPMQESKIIVNKTEKKEDDGGFFGGMTKSLQKVANIASDSVVKQATEIKRSVKRGLREIDHQARKILKEYAQQLNKWATNKAIDFSITMVEKLRPVAKEKMKDPDMCQCVKNFVDDVVDDVWPDVTDEIKFQLMLQFSQPYIKIPEKKVAICCFPCYWVKRNYLYSVDPYDRSIWKQFKTTSWWFWTFISSIPIFGVNQFFYVWDFWMRDMEDEYQCVQFILGFKTTFFLSQGVLKSMIGYYMLYACTSMIDKESTSDQTRCRREGPGANLEEFSELVGFFCEIIFIWAAFMMLQNSKQKGRPVFRFEDDPPPAEKRGCCGKGTRIKYFMFYDLAVLILSVGLFFMCWYLQDMESVDKTGDYIFFAQVSYGILSFPWLVFKIPIVNDRLTKAKQTAYDHKGNCVPTYTAVAIEETKVKKKNLMDFFSVDVDRDLFEDYENAKQMDMRDWEEAVKQEIHEQQNIEE